MGDYQDYLRSKTNAAKPSGFKPLWLPDFLFPFQRHLVDWAIRMGRCALFEDCGLGKTPQQLVWAENVVRKTNGNVLILAPLAVAPQTIREGDKFGIEVHRSRDGQAIKGISVINYQQLHKYNPDNYTGIVADESSILKNFDGKTRRLVTQFLAKIPYRLLCTATPAPNDFMELGTSSEALGVMGRNSMLGMFFTNDGESTQQWRLKGHAKTKFWRWLASWARAVRKPSDLGYEDGDFLLPPLDLKQHTVESEVRNGYLVPVVASSLSEQRVEKRQSLEKRCGKAAEVLPRKRPCIAWCQLNSESDLLEKLIPDAVQVRGSDSDEVKEERLNAFSAGEIRVLVTKPTIAGFGLNWQHCSDIAYFPTHSHEQFYQAIRRCWRFGQKRKVTCNLVYSDGEREVLSNMLRKERVAVEMYDGICRHMGEVLQQKEESNGCVRVDVPKWLSS